MYPRVYGVLEADYPRILAFISRVAIENIANSAPYHNAAPAGGLDSSLVPV
jgi:hypothetical protein